MNKIINALDQYADALEKASVWHNSRTIIGKVKKGKKDFIFEFYCYMRILADLKNNYSIEYDEGNNDWKNRFPKKHAPKKDKPLFKLIDEKGDIVYQVCAGTEIKVIKGDSTASPDISFQTSNSPEVPEAKHVKLIMDAKYTKKKDKKLGKGSFLYFSGLIRDLGLDNAKEEKLDFDTFKDIQGNCLITYGKAYIEDSEYLQNHHLCELEKLNEVDHFRVIK